MPCRQIKFKKKSIPLYLSCSKAENSKSQEERESKYLRG